MNQAQCMQAAIDFATSAQTRANPEVGMVDAAIAQVYATLATIPDPIQHGWSTEQPGQAY